MCHWRCIFQGAFEIRGLHFGILSSLNKQVYHLSEEGGQLGALRQN